MTVIRCPECGSELFDSVEQCPRCGCPIEKGKVENTQDNHNIKTKLHKIKKYILVASVFCFCVSGVFFYKSWNVKNVYRNSEDAPFINENAYVGGDAYNYIINGTYFTGYSVIASSFLISGVVLLNSGLKLLLKEKL